MVKNTISYKYYIKDHLGNNRVVADHQGNVMQYTHYYPYGGMLHLSTEAGYQNFKYNGKEYETMHGLNEYDYGARQYEPAIAQFTSMDPLCEKYYHISPYAYCGGNPVNRVDPDGMDWYERDGKRIWRNSVDGTYSDKQGHEWTNIGHTYTDSKTGMYYSLFGQKYNRNNESTKAVKLIDDALLKYAQQKNESSSEDVNNVFISELDLKEYYNFNGAYSYKKNNLISDYNTHNLYYGVSADQQKGKNAHFTYFNNYSANVSSHANVFEKINTGGMGSGYVGQGIEFRNKNNGVNVYILFENPTIFNKLKNFYKKL